MRIVVLNHVTLDGVMQAAGRPDQDTRGGFEHGGWGALIRSLMPDRLIDEFALMIHPLVLGAGLRLFDNGSAPAELELVDAVPTTRGVILATRRQPDRG